MDGSTADLIIIPIVAMLLLAGWLVAVFHAASHPQWKAQRAAATGEIGSTIFTEDLLQPASLADAAPAEPAHRKVIIPLPLPREPQPAAARRSAAAARYAAEHPAA
jgi:hypothetical protein